MASADARPCEQADEAAAKPGDGLEDLFARLGGDLGGEESEEELKGILETMMSQLMSKDVLYEPLKELHDKVCAPFAPLVASVPLTRRL